MGEIESLLRFDVAPDGGTAGVRVLAGHRSPRRVSRFLTGKFCEHLWHNIDRGMEAQVLQNPTFAAWPFSAGGGGAPDGGIRLECDEDRIPATIRDRAERFGWPAPEQLVDSRRGGLAHWWVAEGGDSSLRFSPDVAPNGDRAQRVEAGTPGGGVAQWTYLPLHRVRRYEWRIVVRSPDLAKLRLALAGPEEEPVAAAELAGLSRKWQTFTGSLVVDESAPADAIFKLALTAPAAGQFVVARVLLYPADHVGGADPDVIRLLRESHLPMLRWPGGNFVSTYHWRDGVGPVDERPTRPNLAWGHPEPNFFGTDEFVAFCRAVGCEPLICVNVGSATPAEAAAWVEYCNGPPDTPGGARRAANGHPEPYGIRLWEIGNEIYGRWQMGWTTPAGYADRFREYAEAMKAADAGIEAWACGVWDSPQWNERLVRDNAAAVTTITDHPLLGGRVTAEMDPLAVYRDFMALPELWREKYDATRQMMLDIGVAAPRLAITELQLFAHLARDEGTTGPLTHETLVSPPTLAEALYDTLWFHMAARMAPFIEVITHSATVNHGGGLRKEQERVYANPCHHAHSLFAAFAGATPVAVELRCAEAAAPGVLTHAPAGTKTPVLEAFAAVTPEGVLLVSLVHCGADGPVSVELTVDGAAPAGPAELWELTSGKPWDRNTVDRPDAVAPVRREIACEAGRLNLTLGPWTLAQLRVPVRPA